MLGIWVGTTQGLPISRCMCYFWNGGSKQGRQKHSPRRVSDSNCSYYLVSSRATNLNDDGHDGFHHVTTTLSEFPTACCFWPLATNVLATSWDFCARRSNFFCDCCNLSRWVFRSNLGKKRSQLGTKVVSGVEMKVTKQDFKPQKILHNYDTRCVYTYIYICIHCIQIVHSI